MAYGHNYYYYKCIRKTIIQFLALFNGIEIERYEQDGTVRGRYMVPLKFAPKSKAYMWVTDLGRDEEMLPMMTVTMTGIDFDINRLTNRNEKIRVDTDYSNLTATYASNAIPYNISFSLQIYALHMVDIDQIYEQILPYFTPYAFFIVNIPEIGLTFEVKVILNSCSPMMTDDATEEEARVIKWETQFQCQMFLFKPTSTVGIIGKLPFDTSPSAAMLTNEGTWTSGASYDVNDVVYDEGTYYVAVSANTSSDINEPGLTSAGDWTPGTEYSPDDVVLNNGTYYVAISANVADGTNEPPNSEYWTPLSEEPDYGIWQEIELPPAPSAWTNDGWTGSWDSTTGTYTYGTSASKGGIITRFYMNPAGWTSRDVPPSAVDLDTRPAETLAIQPVMLLPEVDEEAKILLDYEIFGAQ